jgi:arylsulfatase A-like enzyme
MPLLRREVDAVHDAIFGEITFHAAYEPQRAVRTERFKYIRRFDTTHDRPVLPNVDDSPSKDLLLDHGWAERRVAGEQLYDLVFDPQEAANLAADPAYALVLEQLRDQLEAWMRETGDPLFDGPVSPLPGSRLNRIDQISPDDPIEVVAQEAG